MVGLQPLAKQRGVAYQSVQKWRNADSAPAKQVIGIAKATKWKFTPHQIDPVIYPHPNDGMPDHLRN